MNKTTINALKAFASSLAIFVMVFTFAFPKVASASWDDYGSVWGYDDDYYYEDYTYYEEDYSYDYYQPEYDYSYDYYQPYESYDDYGYDDYYDYGGYDYYQPTGGSYSYPYYSYNTPSYTTTGGATTPYYYYAPVTSQSQSQSNTSTNTNNQNSDNDNTNNNSNTSNNTNNNNSNSNSNSSSNNTNTNNVNVTNPINIVVNNPAPSNNNNNNNNQAPSLDGSCYITPSVAYVNQELTFVANASGGTGSYTYTWSGSDGLSSNSRTFTGRFSYSGIKTANVTIHSGSQSITRSCNVTVDNQNYNPQNPSSNLTAYCVANPTSAYVNQNISWTVYPSGGNGNYSYTWYGTDGLSYGNASAIQKQYTYAGTKTATVTVNSNGQSISATCSAQVLGSNAPVSNVTVIRQPDYGTPSGVYLSQVPATGIDFNLKTSLFAIGLIAWSAFIGYVFVSRRKAQLATATAGAGSAASLQDKINQFKLENMRKKGLTK